MFHKRKASKSVQAAVELAAGRSPAVRPPSFLFPWARTKASTICCRSIRLASLTTSGAEAASGTGTGWVGGPGRPGGRDRGPAGHAPDQAEISCSRIESPSLRTTDCSTTLRADAHSGQS